MAELFRFDVKALKQAATPESAFRTARVVRFHDVDAAGIVFFARVLEYIHDCYCEFLEASGHGLPAVLAAGEWAAPIGHAEVDYFEPLKFGDALELSISGAHLAGSRVTLAHVVRRLESGRVAAVAQTQHVFVSRQAFRPIPIPAALEQRLRELPQAG